MILAGVMIKVIAIDEPSFRQFDYSKQDSLFLKLKAINRDIDSVVHSKSGKEIFAGKYLTGDRKINLNIASQEELTLLPGIGEKTAEKIIQYRKRIGQFKSKEEIMNVKGIGEVKYSRIRDKITVASP
ncbi:MAG: helix-hairpin-helix domain-containing protein [Ignavibacteriaceae bacterium]|nr:helix-hairpin-helix domain-containing protein [Ignavibacteriaceae bacterium]